MTSLIRFLDYMEDIGYDPIGASDMRYLAAIWFGSTPEVWSLKPEEAYEKFMTKFEEEE